MIPGRRFTVVRQSDGHFLLEDVHRGEQVRVDACDRIGDQIERWLQTAEEPLSPVPPLTPITRSPDA